MMITLQAVIMPLKDFNSVNIVESSGEGEMCGPLRSLTFSRSGWWRAYGRYMWAGVEDGDLLGLPIPGGRAVL